jgi:nitroimidazol reductase NimA-like FMN-containing flavoprotein (pyridoxamine 5'-phosphate oxidase superfamily)
MTAPSGTGNSEETRVRRYPDRARYDRATIDSILDEAPFCHVGFIDRGRPVVVPTIHVRVGDDVILHGSPASRMMRILKSGAEISMAVTILDGLVLARAVFNHSMNYRSVVLFGRGTAIEDPAAKLEAMRVFTEKILPGRWNDARSPTDREFRGTLMVAVPIERASAKVRSGPPGDAEEDYDLPVWAGEIPYASRPGEPVPDPRLDPAIPFPDYLKPLWD